MRLEIYQTLRDANGFVSGESLSATLGVTRAALWKHIKAMQADGAQIESVTGMGYRLLAPPDVPRAEYLGAHVQADIPLVYHNTVTSTNDVAKQAAQQDGADSAIFIAGEQTAGKGRKGRTWQSKQGQGIYIGFLIRPKIDPACISGLTLVAATALCDAIAQTTGLDVGIKWPNDIILNGKKAAGILTESMLGMDGIEYVVCGMGINTDAVQFEGELAGKAVSLGASAPINRMLLTAAIIDAFMCGYETFLREGVSSFMRKFRGRNVLTGAVRVISPTSEDSGMFAGFDDTGAILIDCEGETKRFVAGEVSLRGENGYV